MRWGIHRTLAQLGRSISRKIKERKPRSSESSGKKAPKPKRKTARTMTTEELQQRINRMKMEKEYNSLLKETRKLNAGADFASKVLKKSGENIATQYVTYAMGTAINKAMNKNVVNPKKGQKDK